MGVFCEKVLRERERERKEMFQYLGCSFFPNREIIFVLFSLIEK